ncbi:MAG TPA: DUF444 family protein [Steroidobacteraceae bacterium]|nr:DUF444 family protein [Steroidobacteraceae bacterium]
MSADSESSALGLARWYDLFSRGARDWLRHDEKVREAVREHLPQIIAGGEVISDSTRSVRVPVRMLEHYHFRLASPGDSQGVGQGEAQPGDVLADPAGDPGAREKGEGGQGDGQIQLMLEIKIDDIVDWLWEEMQLPNLKARVGPSEDSDWVREGWDRRGARSRLDRRRSFKELVKRQGRQGATATFTDEDLRFRQLARRRQPAIHAVVFFVLDVSGSMSDRDRKLAKTFFFWVVQGLRREYRSLETVFVAHTTEAWEFAEADFFQVTGTGGTVTSTGLNKVRGIIDERYSPARHNIYLFYASDGDNSIGDHADAHAALTDLAGKACFSGYVEVASGLSRQLATETGRLFGELEAAGQPVASYVINDFDGVWGAVRHFFTAESKALGG